MCTQQMGFLFALSVVGLFNNSPLNYDIIIVTTNEVGEQFFEPLWVARDLLYVLQESHYQLLPKPSKLCKKQEYYFHLFDAVCAFFSILIVNVTFRLIAH